MVIIRGPNCNKYQDAKLPPCANLLGNVNPIIKDGRIIFRNYNRLFYFIGSTPKNDSKCPNIQTNIQISLSTYIIGLFIDQIENKIIKYNDNCKIHDDKKLNSFIHELLNKPISFPFCYSTNLTLVYSNGNAILDPFTYIKNISLNNYLILLAINRYENNPHLLFINNASATEDTINFFLSEIDISYPL